MQKKILPRLITLLTLSTSAAMVSAEDKQPWDVEVDLGIINTSGNTKTSSVQTKLDAKQNLEKWENQYIFSALSKSDEVKQDDGSKQKEKTAEKYFGSAKVAYLIGVEKAYLFGFLSHAKDKFGAYDTYTTVAAGYGDWIYSSPTLNWFAEAGPGYFQGEKVIAGAAGEPDVLVDEDGAILRLASALEWKITESAEFKQAVSVEAGDDNTRTVSETSLSSSLSKAMKMKLGLSVSNDSDVAPGKKKTDTTTFLNLVYSF
jgi:putative salt-induced outer membrane protein